jgi:hypothetical protein
MTALAFLVAFSSSLSAATVDDPNRPAAAVRPFDIQIRLVRDREPAFEVSGIDPKDLERLARANWTEARWADLFGIRVGSGPEDLRERPAVLGSYSVVRDVIRFLPRFRLEAGTSYRATFDPSRLPGRSDKERSISATFAIPKPPSPPARVTRVDPTSNRLPENQLKFYVHFSAPMARGDIYRHFHLLQADGKEVEAVFLELEQELWNLQSTRLTLILDPGRVKQGLVPREELGPVLEQGKSFTFVVDRTLPDAQGNPLVADYRKAFHVGPPDTTPPDPKRWTITPPASGSTDSLLLKFDEPLDRGMLDRVLAVKDSDGRRVAGRVLVDDSATAWRFTPESAWGPGHYRIDIQTNLEDLAGNTIGRPFEVDVFEKIDRDPRASAESVSMPFRVGAPSAKR